MIMFFKIGKKNCHFKKDAVMCDSFEIVCIEEIFQHTYFNAFLGSSKVLKYYF